MIANDGLEKKIWNTHKSITSNKIIKSNPVLYGIADQQFGTDRKACISGIGSIPPSEPIKTSRNLGREVSYPLPSEE